MKVNSTFSIIPNKGDEETAPTYRYIDINNPECPTAGQSCQWNMTCELGPKVPS